MDILDKITISVAACLFLLSICVFLWLMKQKDISIRIASKEFENAGQFSKERMAKHSALMINILNRSFENIQEQLDYALNELLKLSGSQYGYIYLYNEEKKEFTINSWTTGVMAECSVKGKPGIYQLENTGIWGEVVRQCKPIIVNDFKHSNPLKKGYPEGHVQLDRFMSIPVIIDNEIVAVVGFGNKATDYSQTDVNEITTLMSIVWNMVKRKESENILAFERNKYYQTLLSIGDGVMIINTDRNVEFLNAVASRLTGWTQNEAKGTSYKEVFMLSHEQEGFTVDDPIEMVFLTGTTHMLGNHGVLTSRNGIQYNLEDSAAPIFDRTGLLAGVVLVFRDITKKKEQRKRIEYMSCHDSLTGLYNRHFFEEELRRLDNESNLPISILVGDINGLKLTNDIFGHAFGDLLLQKVAEIMRSVCRSDDIIARRGGDEYIVLLPKTGPEDIKIIANRIKKHVSEQKIRSIRCGISLGYDTKISKHESIDQTLRNAESNMYLSKTLERGKAQSNALNSIMNSLYESNAREKEHSINVSNLCGKVGAELNLPESDIQKLKYAAKLHDIGKVILSPELLNIDSPVKASEHNEVAKHPVVGYRILNYFDVTLELAEIILFHHENWDGSGYPRGLKGQKIPLLSHIISIAGYYERALCQFDPGDAEKRGEAINKIQQLSGTKFNPEIVDIFIRLHDSHSI